MCNRILLALSVVVLALGGWTFELHGQPSAPKPDAGAKSRLIEADRAFAKATAEKGIDGWMSFMADDAVRIAPLGDKAHVGKAAVRELDTPMFSDPKRRLVWEPTDAGTFADDKHGFTTGRARMLFKTDAGAEEARWTGAYVTLWRLGTDGQWKVILDTGAADAAKP